ncbi:MAG: penicillin-binding protein 1A [Candidatus Margulisiibacteriota bacterium]
MAGKRKKQKKAGTLGKNLLIVMLASAAALVLIIGRLSAQLPDVSRLSSHTPFEATIIYSSDGAVLGTIHGEENRIVVPLNKISSNLQKAVIASEDNDFYRHKGISLKAIARAALVNLFSGKVVQGGSTITQQLARTVFLSTQKTASRKVSEAFLAMQIEKLYTKEEILEMYLNQVYWGHNTYGAEAAAEMYYGKHADALTLAEAAMMSGILGAPEAYSPYKNFDLAVKRRSLVLSKMKDLGMISEKQKKAAEVEPVALSMNKLNKYKFTAPYFTSFVINKLVADYGRDIVYKGGLRVYTTLSIPLQKAAEETITGFINTEGIKYHFLQGALVSLDPNTGKILAMVGGYNFDKSEYNRAAQAKRSPGSSFKPFIYAAAMEKGVSPGEVISDSPMSFDVFPDKDHPDGKWKPMNFDRRFRGNVTVRYALENSLNIPSIKLIQKAGPQNAANLARRLGITSPLTETLSLALGTSDVSLLEMTSSYGVFASNGLRLEPYAIEKVVDRDGKTIEEAEPRAVQVLDPGVASVMVDMMKGVITSGTGRKAALGRPAAAKTGTSERFRDAWFIGFVPQLVTGVWVGNDNNSSMKGVAEVAVCPRMWKDYMTKVLVNTPPQDFAEPSGMVRVRICTVSGQLAGPNCPSAKIRTATFWRGKEPSRQCPSHSAPAPPKEEGSEVEEETIQDIEYDFNQEAF